MTAGAGASDVRIERVVTSGTFSLDGGTRDVDNNVWVVGDAAECVVIDAPQTPEKSDNKRRIIIAVAGSHARLLLGLQLAGVAG